uniref:Myb-like domain-containing protein n=1 Tax=Panagrellus redivivus TaxID=6233 RepID=A0A7E4UZW8_PANRE
MPFSPGSIISYKKLKPLPPTFEVVSILKPPSEVFWTNDVDWDYHPPPNSRLKNAPRGADDNKGDEEEATDGEADYDQQDGHSDGDDDDQECEDTADDQSQLDDGDDNGDDQAVVYAENEVALVGGNSGKNLNNGQYEDDADSNSDGFVFPNQGSLTLAHTHEPAALSPHAEENVNPIVAPTLMPKAVQVDSGIDLAMGDPSTDPTNYDANLVDHNVPIESALDAAHSNEAPYPMEKDATMHVHEESNAVDSEKDPPPPPKSLPKRRRRTKKGVLADVVPESEPATNITSSNAVQADSTTPKKGPPKRRGRPPKAAQPTATITSTPSIQEAESSVPPASGDVETDSSQPTAPKRRRRSRKDPQPVETAASDDTTIEIESPAISAPSSESALGNNQNNNNTPQSGRIPRRPKARVLKRIDLDASDYSDDESTVKTHTKNASLTAPTSFRNPLRTHVGPGQAVFGPSAAARIRQNPMDLMEYLHSAAFLRLTVSERKVMEKMIRAHCLASLDEKLNKYQSVALNIDKVKERLNKFAVDPTPDCDACIRTGKANDANCVDAARQTRPHMTYTLDAHQIYGAKVRHSNPLYVKGIARLPHVRLNSYNMHQLSDAIQPVHHRRIPQNPVVVHTCQKWYGTFETSKNGRTMNASTKYIRPLFICRSIFSKNGWQKQSELLKERIDSHQNRFLRSYDQKPRRRTSSVPRNAEATRYSTNRSKLRVRVSRSLSPVRRCHPASSNSKPIAIKWAYGAGGETFSLENGIAEVDDADVAEKIFLSMPMEHAGQTAFFSFASAEKGIIMPSRPAGINAQQGFHFKKCSVRAIGPSWMNIFEFTVIEDQVFEYLFRMRVGNNSGADFRELRPVDDCGSIMPIRIVYDYLRLTRKTPRPATWVKNALKINTDHASARKKEPKKDVVFAERPGGHVPVMFTLYDVLKFLGMYSIHVNPDNPVYACTMAYLSTNPKAAKKAKTLFDLLKLTYDCQGICGPKTPEFDLVRKHLMWLGKYNQAHTPELRLLRTKVRYVPSNKARTNLCCFTLEKKLTVMEQLSINSELEDFWQRFTEIRSDSDSDEFDSDVASDYDWDFGAMVYHLGSPKVVFPEFYDKGKVQMTDFRGRDISDVIPNSKLLDDIREKHGCVAEVRSKNKRYKRRYKYWDESSDEEESAVEPSPKKVARIAHAAVAPALDRGDEMPPPEFYDNGAEDESVIDTSTVEMTAPIEVDDVQSASTSVPIAPVCVLQPIHLDAEDSSNGIQAADDDDVDEYEAVFENYAARL